MSEGAIPIKKAFLIIVVAWILSLVTTLGVVYLVPIMLRPTWHEVLIHGDEYTAYTREEDKAFFVPSDHWKIEWIVMPIDYPSSEDTWFTFYLDSEDYVTFTQRAVTPADFEWDSTGYAGTEYITGSGDFSITVAGENVLWSITVEAYY